VEVRWESAWEEFIPFLDNDIEIRTVICSTNAIESLNARYRRAVQARSHFPTEQAALKRLHLVTRSLDPTSPAHSPMDYALEARSQRIRHHLRRPLAGRGDLPNENRRKHRYRDSPEPGAEPRAGSLTIAFSFRTAQDTASEPTTRPEC